MPAHNTAQKEKKSKGPVGKAGGKTMGKKDRKAVENNWDNIEEYLSLIKQRVIVDGLTVARVNKMVGASRCEVQNMNGIVEIYPIGGCIKLTSGHKLHVQACMSTGSVVLINGGQITGTLTPGQMVRAERYLRTIQELGIADLKPNPAGGCVLRIPSEFLGRVRTEARIAFPPTFFGAAASDAEEGNYEFDREEETAPERVKARTEVLNDEDDGEDDGIDLDDL
jgi:hypothetical protein